VPRRGLGRGLEALIPGTDEGEIQELPVEAVTCSRLQPRQTLDQAKLEELAQSIREHGVIQPVVVRRAGDGYELVVGERRWRAAMLAGVATIPAVVRELEDAAAMQLALIENLQREDLNPMEEAQAYRRLIEEFGFTQEAIAQRVGRDRTHIAHCLRLLGLDGEVQAAISRGELSLGHAKVLAGVGSPAEQRALARKVRDAALSVRALEELAGKGGDGRRRAPRQDARAPELVDLEDRLTRQLGTRVRIRPAREGGRIEIQYFSSSDLERLAEWLLGERGGPV